MTDYFKNKYSTMNYEVWSEFSGCKIAEFHFRFLAEKFVESMKHPEQYTVKAKQ